MTPGANGRRYVGAAAIVAGVTALSALLGHHAEPADLTMLYLLGVVVSAIAFGRGPAIAAALLSVAAFDFLFVPPRFTFRVSEARYLVTFAVMLVVAAITGTLTARLRDQRERALIRERRVASLHRLSHDLAVRGSAVDVLEAAVARIGELPGIEAAANLPNAQGAMVVAAGNSSILEPEAERAAALASLRHGRPTGFPPGANPGIRGVHFPLIAGTRVNAVLSLRGTEPGALV